MEKQIHGGNIFDKDILLDYSVRSMRITNIL